MSSSSKKQWFSFVQSRKFKRTLLVCWIITVCSVLCYYLLNRDQFSPHRVASFLKDHHTVLLLSYFIVSMVRGWFLIPSTPFVVAGILLFPDQLFWVFGISLLGVTFSGAFIYYFAQYLEMDRLVIKKKKHMERVQKGINRFGFWVVLAWSFFPVVPTDLICYAASITRMHFWKFIAALFLGEALLIAGYIWLGDGVLTYFFF